MRDLVRTNDPVLLNYIEVLLADAGIDAVVFDSNMSTAQGTLSIVQKRLAVPEDSLESARRLLREADLGEWNVKVTGPGPAGKAEDQLTDDAFLGGALAILQPVSGYRAGLDAVMLAAAVPAAAGMRVLDVGAGVGTAGLCLARRVVGVRVVLLEKERALARIAEENVARNGLSASVRVVAGEVGMAKLALEAAGLADESFDHVIANPPYHDADAGTAAGDPHKAAAHAMGGDGLDAWARFMARMAAPGGIVTVIHKAEALVRLLQVLDVRFGALKVLPLSPREGAAATRILVQGTKASRAPPVLLAPFVLHGADGGFTPPAQAILRTGASLPLVQPV